jgi:hypothetical protein
MSIGIKEALTEHNQAAFVAQFNVLLSKFPYDYYQKKGDEYFYCQPLLIFLGSMGLDIRAEQNGSWRRVDFW